jgi:2-oxoglutarate ferredoxin oxidoreductase subunit delta
MSHVEIREDRCKGCLLCTTVCPQEIIVQADRFNKSGYKVVEVPEAKMEECIGCAACAQICPDMCITVYRTVKDKKKGEKQDATA